MRQQQDLVLGLRLGRSIFIQNLSWISCFGPCRAFSRRNPSDDKLDCENLKLGGWQSCYPHQNECLSLTLDHTSGGATRRMDPPTLRGPGTHMEHRWHHSGYLVPYQQRSGNVASSRETFQERCFSGILWVGCRLLADKLEPHKWYHSFFVWIKKQSLLLCVKSGSIPIFFFLVSFRSPLPNVSFNGIWGDCGPRPVSGEVCGEHERRVAPSRGWAVRHPDRGNQAPAGQLVQTQERGHLHQVSQQWSSSPLL